MAQWIAYALIAMVLLSASNLLFKLLAKETSSVAWQRLYPLAGFMVLAALVCFAYAAFVLKLPSFWLMTLSAMAVLSVGAASLIFLSLQTGKVALVTAILGLSTVLVAIFSFVFLGDRFSGRELMAMGLAVLSVLFLVL